MRPTAKALAPALFLLLIFLLQLRIGVERSSAWAGLSRDGLLAGRWWPLLVSPYLHLSLVHLALNGAGLTLFAWMMARRLGGWAFLALLLVCGLGGEAGYLLLHFDSREPAVGASDIVFGLWGAYARLGGGPATLRSLPDRFVARQVLGAVLVNLALVVALRLTTGAWAAWAGHLGGFLTGLILIQPLSRCQARP